MIIEIDQSRFDEVVAFAWEQTSQSDKRGFPRLHTYEAMYDRFLRSLQHEEDKILACYHDEALVGVLNLYVINQELYLQSIGGILVRDDFNTVAHEFIEYLDENFHGYEFHSGYPRENVEAINYFETINADLMDACVTMKLYKDDFNRQSVTGDVIELTPEYHDVYAKFHDHHYATAYWNSKRVFENLDMWKIYMVMNHNQIIGSLFIKFKTIEPEVFGLAIDPAFKHQGLELKLISESAHDLIKNGVENLLFFVDESAEEEIMATLKVGYKQIDTYRSYKVTINGTETI